MMISDREEELSIYRCMLLWLINHYLVNYGSCWNHFASETYRNDITKVILNYLLSPSSTSMYLWCRTGNMFLSNDFQWVGWVYTLGLYQDALQKPHQNYIIFKNITLNVNTNCMLFQIEILMHHAMWISIITLGTLTLGVCTDRDTPTTYRGLRYSKLYFEYIPGGTDSDKDDPR